MTDFGHLPEQVLRRTYGHGWGRSMREAFPEVVDALQSLPDAVLDGELVVPDVEGHSD